MIGAPRYASIKEIDKAISAGRLEEGSKFELAGEYVGCTHNNKTVILALTDGKVEVSKGYDLKYDMCIDFDKISTPPVREDNIIVPVVIDSTSFDWTLRVFDHHVLPAFIDPFEYPASS